MRPLNQGFFRDNLLGLSLTFIGVLCLVLSVMLNLGHHGFSKFALADGGLDGPDIDILERQNKAYERIAQSVTPEDGALPGALKIEVKKQDGTKEIILLVPSDTPPGGD